MSPENEENAAIGRLSEGLERGGITVKKGSWLEKVLQDTSFSTDALNEINNWVHDIDISPEIEVEEQLDNLKERLAPLLRDYKSFKDNFVETHPLNIDSSK